MHFAFQSEPDFVPIGPNDDGFTMREIAFHLSFGWTEWVAQPPLRISKWREQIRPLQNYGLGLEDRVANREANRRSYASEFDMVRTWLEQCGKPTKNIDVKWLQQQLPKVATALLTDWGSGVRSSCRTVDTMRMK